MSRRDRWLGVALAVALAAGGGAASAGPLVDAARANEAGRVRELLASGSPVTEVSVDNTTALHWAAHNENADLVKLLLKARAPVNARNDYGATPLSEAATVANTGIIRQLLSAGADVESANDDGQTALMLVARTDNVEAAQLLVKKRAKLDAREKWKQQTPLMWAAAESQPKMVEYLAKAGADVNARSLVNDWPTQVTVEPRGQGRPSGGFTPLLYAARVGCVECARALLKHRADVNLTDPDGITPLLSAVTNLNFDTAKLLLQAGADANRWDLWGRAPLYAAIDLNQLPDGGRADRPSRDDTTALDIAAMLLKAGANPNLQLKMMQPYRSLRDDRGADNMQTTGATALLRAARAADLPAMKLLIDSGANVDLPNVNGITPLMAVAGNAQTKVDTRGRYKTQEEALQAIDLLVAAGAKVDSLDGQGQSALFGAAVRGWDDVVRKLVGLGAQVARKDARGRTAADVALGDASSASGRAGSDPQPKTAALLRDLMASNKTP